MRCIHPPSTILSSSNPMTSQIRISAGLGALEPTRWAWTFGTFSQNIPKLQNKNGARRLDTTHLPRCTRSLTSFLWLIKCLRRVGAVANALFTTSALNSSPSTILCRDFQAGPPDPSSSWKIIDFRRKKSQNFRKIKTFIFRPRAFPPPPPCLNHCFNTLETPPQAPQSPF